MAIALFNTNILGQHDWVFMPEGLMSPRSGGG
jgi:hypothetical protein